jgi:hypothetical protein
MLFPMRGRVILDPLPCAHAEFSEHIAGPGRHNETLMLTAGPKGCDQDILWGGPAAAYR